MKTPYYLLAETLHEHLQILFRGTFVWLFFACLFIGAVIILIIAKKRRQKK